jgi:hypothetical protein
MVLLLLTGLFCWAAFFWCSLVGCIKNPNLPNLIALIVSTMFMVLIMADYSPNDICEVLK